jgi:acetyl-CoA C-acetyltransferase
VRVETYTVTFDREGNPERGIVACRTKDDARAWGSAVDPDVLRALWTQDPIGRTATLHADGSFELRS